MTAVIRRAGLLILALLFAGLPAAAALAQQDGITRIEIRKLDVSAFPEVALTAGIYRADGSAASLAELSALEVLENGDPVSRSVFPAAAPLELLVVLDAGSGITAPGASGAARLDEMKSFLLALLEQALQPGDRLGITLVTPGVIASLQELTADHELLRQVVENLSLPPTADVTDGIAGAAQGLATLQASTNHTAVRQRLVYLSMGVQSGSEGAAALNEEARRLEIPCDAVLFRADAAPHARLLKGLAGDTGGYYLHYSGAQAAAGYFAWLEQEHQVFRIGYRSVSVVRSLRPVELRLPVTGSPLGDARSYQVELQLPLVTIDAPAAGAEISRSAAEGAESYTVTASLAWPDGYPRLLSQAQLWLDGRLAQVWIPAGQEIRLEWDLRQYDAGSHPVRLQILVRDELGIESLSAPVTVQVAALEPAAAPPAAEDCSGEPGLSWLRCQVSVLPPQQLSLLLILALVILLAGLLVVRLLRASRAPKLRPDDHETNTRLTAPVDNRVGAYLEVKSGDETLQGKLIPLYVEMVTPVGRSPHEAELVFQVNNERSVISRLHCEFKETNGLFTLRDLGSSRGTYLNGRRLLPASDAITLRDGDQIELGPVERGGLLLVFHTLESPLLKPQDSLPH